MWQVLIYNYVEGIVDIAHKSVEAIESGDVCALGAQMTLAQSLFDANCMPNCPSELTSPRLHALMEDSVLKELCVAVKGVGSQGDGSAQLLCASADLQEKVKRCPSGNKTDLGTRLTNRFFYSIFLVLCSAGAGSRPR